MVEIFFGLPTDLLIVLVIAVAAVVIFGYMSLVKTVPAKCLYVNRANEGWKYTVKDVIGAPIIQLIKNRKPVLALRKKASAILVHTGGMKTERLFLAYENYPETISPEQLTTTAEAIDKSAEINLLQESVEGFRQAVQAENEAARGFSRGILMYCLLSGGCGMAVTFLIMMLMGRLT